MYIMMRGLPVLGADIDWPGERKEEITSVPVFRDPIRGITVQPCYLRFEKIDDNWCEITAYGQQTHVWLWEKGEK